MASPVKHTCPDIDKVVVAIRAAIKSAQKGQQNVDKQHESQDYFWDIVYQLDGLENILEELRKSNAILREWGEELEKQMDEPEMKQ